MTLAMTLMVRNEADIVSTMIDFHISQGVDVFIVTDNGSTDGTQEILQEYADDGRIQLRHDPVQRKQQASVVTAMARDAFISHHADWVLNADADEFWIPLDRSRTLGEIFAEMPTSLRSFPVPVVNLTGAPATTGTGIQRLVYRDQRPLEALNEVGIRAHPTANAVHVGSADIEVAQGNHEVSLASQGRPEAALDLEVLHLPWRSWTQYRTKIDMAGRAYNSNPELTPSPNHHGMRDWARLQAGALLPYYLLRHPDAAELETGERDGAFRLDPVLAERLPSLVPDSPIDPADMDAHQRTAPALRDAERRIAALEADHREEIAQLDRAALEIAAELDLVRQNRDRLAYEGEMYRRERDESHAVSDELSLQIRELNARRVVRMTDRLRDIMHRPGE